MSRLPLGTFVGARSGDKGGNANVGVWVVDPVEPAAVDLAHGRDAALAPAPDVVRLADERYAWLAGLLTADRVRDLLPECARLAIDVHPLPNLRAVNIVIHGRLGRGGAETSRVDPQAKGLGEHLRARLVDIPDELLGPAAGAPA
ncbi:MAG: AtuA-related protein [Candidatus Nanopelagicales bacterium]